MALNDYALPFGLRQVKLTPIDDSGALVKEEAVFLPASRTFSFGDTEEFETLEGDDRTVASHGAGPTVAWELEGGGISLPVWRVLAGGTVSESGVSPAAIRKFSKKTSDSRPYFQAEGRAISDNGGDFHGVVHRCKADGDLEAEMANGAFLLTSASGTGFGDEDSEELYEFYQNETATAIQLYATVGTAGIPGTFNGEAPETFAELSASSITASPATLWTVGQYVELGDASQAHWNGTAWASGAAPA
jgi:hypothetical protein